MLRLLSVGSWFDGLVLGMVVCTCFGLFGCLVICFASGWDGSSDGLMVVAWFVFGSWF